MRGRRCSHQPPASSLLPGDYGGVVIFVYILNRETDPRKPVELIADWNLDEETDLGA
jgi:hypothetical protein